MIKHLALIMDGNRRWAVKKKLNPWMGHKEGIKSVQRTIDFCINKQIPFLSLYLFSIENLKRAANEKKYLFNLLVKSINNFIPTLLDKEVRVNFIGDRNLFPENVNKACKKIEKATESCSKLNLNFLFCYGGRQEILNAVKSIVKAAKKGLIDESNITEGVFFNHFWLKNTPDPDIIIRTGGHKRLSNFLLYQSAYSELFFLNILWPEIKNEDLESICMEFYKRKRNFGA